MNVLAIVQNKGGDGKSTCAITLGLYYALIKDKRTLLIDFDPQCNCSSRFLTMEFDDAASSMKDSTWRPPLHPHYDENDPENDGWDGRSCSADLFLGDMGVEPYPCNQFPNLDILPGWSARLDTVERVTNRDIEEKVIRKCQKLMELIKEKDLYDIVIFDTPPLLRPLTLAALGCATDVVIPMQLAQASLNGLFSILGKIQAQRDIRPNQANIAGIVPTRVKEKTVRTKRILNELESNEEVSAALLSPIPEREGIAMLCEWGDHSVTDVERTFDSPFTDSPSNKKIRDIMLNFCDEVDRRLLNVN